ncbi:HlyC/CorC family transporter [Aeromicrobium sp.]|nr:HlyC/CorC family transporter [Candidatus Saccharibacteria bacterium]
MLIGNAFFVGAEFGLVSARRSNIELKALNGSRAAKATLKAMEQVSLMLAGAQLGVTLCSLIFGAVGEPLIAHLLEKPFQALGLTDLWLETVSLVLALGLMVYAHVVIGEMVPKNLALSEPTRAALILVPPLFLLVKALSPVIVSLNAVANGSLRLLGIRPRQEIASSFSRDEVAGFVKESHLGGLLSEEEEHLLSGTLDFEGRTVKSVILPFDKAVITSTKPTAEEVERFATTTGYSRFPVAGKKGSLRGYVHLKDLLQIADDQIQQALPGRFIRPLATVKASTSLRSALAVMQQSGAHIAQVTNGNGKLLGVVMLEDVLEELVGSIRDDTRK